MHEHHSNARVFMHEFYVVVVANQLLAGVINRLHHSRQALLFASYAPIRPDEDKFVVSQFVDLLFVVGGERVG